MNSLKKDKLQTILGDDVIIGAIKDIFDEIIDKHKPLVDSFGTNELLGEKYRAYEKAREMVEDAFVEVVSYKVEKNKEGTFNKAR